ncbi:hypothetical protein DRO51_01660, partial [Candidatus Bathyarchaeota archaeon]
PEERDNFLDFYKDEYNRPVLNGYVKPFGLKFFFLISPKMTEEDKERTKVGIKVNSGINRYYSAVYCVFDSPKAYGFSVQEEDNVVLKVLCVKPIVAVKKDEEEVFYEDLKSIFSEWLSKALENENYNCKLLEWHLIERLYP